MLSKISWFNKELAVQIGRSAGWISIVYFLGLLIALPIRIMMMYSDKQSLPLQKINNLFQPNFSFQLPLLITIPVLMAIFLFRYLHVKKMADLMHSIPMKREKLFHHYAISGIILLVLPIVVIAIILLLTHSVMDLGAYFTKKDILDWAGMTILINLILYAVSVFVAMMTGMSIVHAVLTYAVLVFPVGITVLVLFNLSILLYGFPSDVFLAKQLEKISPLTYATVLDRKPFIWSVAAMYGGIALILYWLSLCFYKKRKVEAASEAIAFVNLRAIFKYGVTFSVMLVGGAYFQQVSYNSLGWAIFGYVIGAAAGYYLAEMVVQKSWRVFGKVKGLAIYLVVFILATVAVKSMGFYENRIPSQAEVKSVLLGNNPMFLSPIGSNGGYYPPLPMKSQASIEAVRKLHQQIVANQNINRQKENHKEDLVVKYEFNDGSTILREYRVDKRLYEDSFKDVYQTEDYKRSMNEIFRIKPNEVQSISIFANSSDGRKVMIYEPAEVNQLFERLKEDILSETYEDSLYFANRGSSIQIDIGKERSVSLTFKPTYHRVAAWLQEKSLLDKAKVTADDLESMVVAKNDFGKEYDARVIEKKVENNPSAFRITNKGQLEMALNQAGVRPADYVALLYYKWSKQPEIFYFDQEHVPDFVKKVLE
ncbi:DUF6449 domain-containing protein [Neobacillus sp. SM06]|uniref:DUF6449 domain-containing protein n=1 Tax=Neobacillus sp. SM06 TaxID=3422492 RepID=UPI003D26D3B1